MLDVINRDTNYILLPLHDPLLPKKSRVMSGSELIEKIGENISSKAFLKGELIEFNNNKYFIDEVI